MRTCSAQSAAGPRVSSHTTPPMVHDAGAGAATVPRGPFQIPSRSPVCSPMMPSGGSPWSRWYAVSALTLDNPNQSSGPVKEYPNASSTCSAHSAAGPRVSRRTMPPIVQIGPGAGGGGVVSGSVGGVGGSEGGGAANAVTPGTSTTAARKAASSARPVRCAPTRLPRPNMDGNGTWLLHRDHPQPLVAPRRSRISRVRFSTIGRTPSAGASAVTSRRRPSQSRNSRVPRTCSTTHDGSLPSGYAQ